MIIWYRWNPGSSESQLLTSVQRERLFPSLNKSKMLIIKIKQDTSLSMAPANFLSSRSVLFAESIFLNC